ncbi:DUF433 domain-containing protein [Synechococcales cyanobacterium C]|uniref:DUF433 domain-containing protein n=1 Tax=Petrachloros mirabilis ULC683 TaxID=2781853 RepID=A0A8K2A708_9CYAN|nr:DUF433 domain-containing protein [Petrachloros mirabilis]NCJ05724.1 DUF433 domain-containing protein [Petrachloros mirabilis ULC683]
MENVNSLDMLECHPDKVSGAWVFKGTRVPVSAFFENLKDGASIDQFLEWFPGVARAQVEALLDYELSQPPDCHRRFDDDLMAAHPATY